VAHKIRPLLQHLKEMNLEIFPSEKERRAFIKGFLKNHGCTEPEMCIIFVIFYLNRCQVKPITPQILSGHLSHIVSQLDHVLLRLERAHHIRKDPVTHHLTIID
jgi:hypothetical protein